LAALLNDLVERSPIGHAWIERVGAMPSQGVTSMFSFGRSVGQVEGLLPAPFNSKPVILDIGYSDQVPGSIRRAVALRARHCEWPGCRKRPAACDVHHLRHKRDGGETSIRNCVLLCQFHHDICIHRQGWRLVLHPDGTTTAHGPRGQKLPGSLHREGFA